MIEPPDNADMPGHANYSTLFDSTTCQTIKASKVLVGGCSVERAREFIRVHHSRLPQTQRGPWMYSFAAVHPGSGHMYGAALWHNPSARTLPQGWLELRRMAVSVDAPHCMASSFLQRMVRLLVLKGHRHFISYQDSDVHKGTIYKAAGWSVEHIGKARVRERGYSPARGRDYRTSLNGSVPDVASKVRWGYAPLPEPEEGE